MWRKLLIICLFGAFFCKTAGADNATHDSRESTTLARSSQDLADEQPGLDARRIALVIGNDNYDNDPLGTPINDARAISHTLSALGFQVMRYENVTRQQMEHAVHAFKRRLGPGGVGLFYFAGHGFRVSDTTLLAAVGADSRSPRGLLEHSIDLKSVLQGMAGPRPGKLNLVILDTCLNNPFTPIDTGTIDDIRPPPQTLIAYATTPGSLAAEGARHGIYTAELLKAMVVPGRSIQEIFHHVASSVRHLTNQRQAPQLATSLSNEFLFLTAQQDARPSSNLPSIQHDNTPRTRAILPKDSAEQYELAFWDSIKDSNHPADYEAYLQAYPKGRFAALARARIERLRAAAPKAETPQERPAPTTKAPERQRPAPTTKAAPEKQRPAKEPPAQARPAPEKETPKQATPAPVAPPSVASGGGEEIRDCPTCPVLISLPGGVFTMGSNTGDPSEKPAHRVAIGAPFAIGKFEVTVEQWNACVEAGGCPRLTSDANRAPSAPVRDVSWDDAQQYVKWLTKVSGKPYRLPSEAEWEFAARGGTTTRFWWGEQMRPGQANCKECGEPWNQDGPANAGSFAPNPFGLHDVNGSVWEWVGDCWHNSYKGAPDDGRSRDTPNCRERVIRGGSWREGATYMPSTTRFKYATSVRNSQNGFRVARDL